MLQSSGGECVAHALRLLPNAASHSVCVGSAQHDWRAHGVDYHPQHQPFLRQAGELGLRGVSSADHGLPDLDEQVVGNLLDEPRGRPFEDAVYYLK